MILGVIRMNDPGKNGRVNLKEGPLAPLLVDMGLSVR